MLPWLPSGCLLAHHRPDTAPQENSRTHLQTLVLFSLQMTKQRVRGERALLNALTLFNSGSRDQKEGLVCHWYVAGAQGLDSEHSARPHVFSAYPAGGYCPENESFLEAYRAPRVASRTLEGTGTPHELLPLLRSRRSVGLEVCTS